MLLRDDILNLTTKLEEMNTRLTQMEKRISLIEEKAREFEKSINRSIEFTHGLIDDKIKELSKEVERTEKNGERFDGRKSSNNREDGERIE